MSIVRKFLTHLGNVGRGLIGGSRLFVVDGQGSVERLTQLYANVRDVYAAGRTFLPKSPPSRPNTIQDALEQAKDAAVYLNSLNKYLREQVFPVINRVKLLATGNREDYSAVDEVEAKSVDVATINSCQKARDMLDKISALGFRRDEMEVIESVGDVPELVTKLNTEALKRMVARGLESLYAVAPAVKIAPNGKAFSMTDQVWFLDPVSHEIVLRTNTNHTYPTFNDGGLASSPTFVAGEYYTAIHLENTAPTGYVTMPPKAGEYEWNAVAAVHVSLFNDNGTGAQGDVSAAGTMELYIKAWTADTLGGTEVDSKVTKVIIEDALTAAGDEVFEVYAQVAMPLTARTTPSSKSRFMHIDIAVCNIDSPSAVSSTGMKLVANSVVEVSNLRLIGRPKVLEVDYTSITYRDATGINTIKKDDTFLTFFGNLIIDEHDDPNFSVAALYRDRIGASGLVLGSMIQTLIQYSDKNHSGSDTLNQKYINLKATGGIADMIGVRQYLSQDKSPFGSATGDPVTNPDDITFLFSTLVEDMRELSEMLMYDTKLAKQLVSNLSFSTSQNVSI
jgi:hypothetical protein